ncbi:MAG TPA: lysophospholipid acyltransferase family protein [Polyangiaceae bacterium]|jgi:1-acyl-sn-glycerol-3-phosphate acyltransferase|nr:lysophospholipid acyltransferase family protein [Polyangiaceae bacterium]
MMGILRGIWQNLAAWVFTAVFGSLVILVSILTLGAFSETFGRRMMRIWGHTVLWIAGVTLETSGMEHLAPREKRVITFNHGSILDIFIVLALLPEGGVPVVKREVYYYPFAGWGVPFLPILVIDRGNPVRARASLQKTAARMNGEKLSVVISPEGTRSRTGALGRFKLGPFQIAHQSQAPIVPLVIFGAYEVWPRGSWYSRGGHVRVHAHPRVTLEGVTEGDLRASADALHAFYEEMLRAGAGASREAA